MCLTSWRYLRNIEFQPTSSIDLKLSTATYQIGHVKTHWNQRGQNSLSSIASAVPLYLFQRFRKFDDRNKY